MQTLVILEATANGAGATASAIAALLWLIASATPIPAFPDVGLDSGSEVFEPVRRAIQTAARRNAWAASISGAAALAFFFAALIRVLQLSYP